MHIDFKPSEKQYEVWKCLQPECPICGGRVTQVECGTDRNGQPLYKAVCLNCGNEDIPQAILEGGAAGGGKSWLGSAWLISSCIRWDDMRMVVARLTLKSLRESTWNTIRSIVRNWGLEEDNSKIIMKELADTLIDPDFQRLGSSEYSGAFVDEVGQISKKAIDVLGSRIRWKVESTTVVPKLLMSTNPCLGWVRDRFVMDEEGNDVVLQKHDRYIPFSVFDNPDEKFRRAYLVALDNIKDRATKERLKYGNWNWVDTNEAAAYWNFDGSKHLFTKLRESYYDPTKPLIISWDFNVMPYMSTWKKCSESLRIRRTTLQGLQES